LAYLIGVFGVTVVGNVPMNDQLEQFDISGSTVEAIKKCVIILRADGIS
jgi:uncharacterized membrane protein